MNEKKYWIVKREGAHATIRCPYCYEWYECTEPVCVALCAAYAGQQITGSIQSVTVRTNTGIYKNGMSAGIPNCPQVGLSWAAAIGCLLKNPEKQP